MADGTDREESSNRYNIYYEIFYHWSFHTFTHSMHSDRSFRQDDRA
jgi:hypothetical protein